MSYFLSLIIVLAPVFSNYVFWGPISIGDFLVFVAVLSLLKKFKPSIVNVSAIFLCFSTIFVGLYILYRYGAYGIDPGFFRMSFYYVLFIFILSLQYIKLKNFFSLYVLFSIFFSISLIVQWVIYQVFRVAIPLQLPIQFYEADTLTVLEGIFRSGGWFKEPSYFAIYTMPVLFYLLNKKYYLKYLCVAFAGIVSTSSLAVFVILLSVVLFFVKTKRGWLWLICLVPLFVAAIFYILRFFSEWTFVARILDILFDGGTLNDRVGPVFDIIYLSDGLAPNPVAQHLVVSGGETGSIWYSSFAYILASLGWFGMIFMLLNLFRLERSAGIMLFILILSAHIFSGVYSFFVVFAFLAVERELKNTSVFNAPLLKSMPLTQEI